MEGLLCSTIAESYEDAGGNQYQCTFSALEKTASGGTQDDDCGADQYSWFGQSCVTCDTTYSSHDCDAMMVENDIYCVPGKNVQDDGLCGYDDINSIEYSEGKG